MRSNVREYELIAPKSLGIALKMLADEPGAVIPIAGGTELMVALAAGRLLSRRLISIAGLRELRFIEVAEDWITLGSGSTFTDLRGHQAVAQYFPLLSQAAGWVGGIANQNRGTLGGNLANASPAADSSPTLLVYDAEIELISAAGTRRLPYREFHLGYKQTALRKDELIYSVRLPITREMERFGVSYLRKVGARNAMAISKTVLAGRARLEEGVLRDLRLAAASLGPTPMRLSNTEEVMIGQRITAALIHDARAALTAEVAPIDDIRSTANYRSAVAANLLQEFLGMCLAETRR